MREISVFVWFGNWEFSEEFGLCLYVFDLLFEMEVMIYIVFLFVMFLLFLFCSYLEVVM